MKLEGKERDGEEEKEKEQEGKEEVEVEEKAAAMTKTFLPSFLPSDFFLPLAVAVAAQAQQWWIRGQRIQTPKVILNFKFTFIP